MVEHRRTRDFKIAFAIGLGTMIAAGIFSLSGTAVAAIGIGSLMGRQGQPPRPDRAAAWPGTDSSTAAESRSR